MTDKGSPQPETPPSIYNVDQEVSVNAYFDAMAGDETVRLQITARHGANEASIVRLTNSVLAAYSILRAEHPRPEKPAPPEPQEHPAPESNGKKPYERRPVPYDELPPELQVGSAEGGPIDVYKEDFDWCVIEPVVNDRNNLRTSVKFYRTGLEFPVGAPINKWKPESVTDALQALGDIDVSEPHKITVQGTQFYKDGKSYEYKGQERRYKDLLAVIKR